MTAKFQKHWYKNKKISIPLGIFVFLLALRMILQPIAEKQLNKFLANFSDSLSFHVDHLGIHIIRGAYSFDGVSGKLKSQKRDFLKIESIDVSIAWRELLKGKIKTDVEIDGLDFSYTGELKNAFAKIPNKKSEEGLKGDATEVKDTLFPVKVDRLDIDDSIIAFDDYPGLEEGQKFKISNITGRVTNLTPGKDFPLTFYNIQGNVMNSALFKGVGHINTLAKPIEWDIDSELQNFNLKAANQFLLRKLPLTFTKGELDLYAEAISKKGKVEGYVKPFMKDIDVIKTSESFKGPKHWFIEVVTALSNLVLRAKDPKSVATKIPFSVDDKGMHIDSGEALSKAIEHGFVQQLSPGVEDKYGLE